MVLGTIRLCYWTLFGVFAIGTFGRSVLTAQVSAPQLNIHPSAAELTVQRENLEKQLNDRESAGARLEDGSLRPLEERLLTVAEQEQGARQQQPLAAKLLNSATNIVSIPVFFLTDRTKAENNYTATPRKVGMDYGIAQTTLGYSGAVRPDRIAGAMGRPQSTRPTALTIIPLHGEAELLGELSKNSANPHSPIRRRVLLFVHGYHTSFEDAVDMAARLATAVQFPVVPLVYAWPSEGTYLGYWHDEDTVMASFVSFSEFLTALLNQPDYDVVIICHSMGARVVTAALSELGRHSVKLPGLKQVVYAAGDISVDQFDKDWPGMQRLKPVKFSFYASDADVPLHLSHFVHGYKRLGDASPDVHAPGGADSMDASSVDSVLQGLGHSYIVQSPRIGEDISRWIENGDSPLERDLVKKIGSDGTYYIFP
jgi:esterase/lipase superfamily enzyme